MTSLSQLIRHKPRSVRQLFVLAQALLLSLPFLYLPGFGSYASLRYFVFGFGVLIMSWLLARVWLDQPAIFKAVVRSRPLIAMAFFVAAFLLVSALSTQSTLSFFSNFQRTDGFFAWLFLALFSFAIATSVILLGERALYRLLSVSTIGAALFAGSLFLLIGSSAWVETRGGGLIGNSSLAALYLGWHFFISIVLWRRASVGWRRWLWLAAFLLIIASPIFVNYGWLFGNSDAGWLGLLGEARGGILGIVFGAFFGLGLWLRRAGRKLWQRVGVGIMALVALVFLCGGYQLLSEGSRLHQAFVSVATGTRFVFWEAGWAGFLERPLFGFGPGTFSEVYHGHFNPAIFESPNVPEVLVDKPHNIFIEFLAGGGVVLVSTFVLLLGVLMRGIYQLSKTQRLLASAYGAALVAWFVQVQFVFDSLSSLAMLMLLIGCVSAQSASLLPGGRRLNDGGRRIVLSGVVAILIMLTYVALWLPAQKAFRMERVYAMNLPARADAWETLSGISPMGDGYDSALMFTRIYEAYRNGAQELRGSDPLLKEAALAELDAIGHYLDSVLTKRGEQFELVWAAAQLQYVQVLIDETPSLQEIHRAKELIALAQRISPTDPRPGELLVELAAF